ncbi:uncharacterized protein LOC127363980 isoform X3 [Dicentrarchus labrax]|uniref:uncharacterized protein LOC127363980 isoform X3 n=1 Tax=Dicentrarchus labrax TaxID=13489 RepID=UPI0021F61A55|nr:uncharacterized protein LOC127363980 isoform X3 [Dicentrarchus labrax]
MKMLAVSVLVVAMMALTRAAPLPDSEASVATEGTIQENSETAPVTEILTEQSSETAPVTEETIEETYFTDEDEVSGSGDDISGTESTDEENAKSGNGTAAPTNGNHHGPSDPLTCEEFCRHNFHTFSSWEMEICCEALRPYPASVQGMSIEEIGALVYSGQVWIGDFEAQQEKHAGIY